MKNFTHYILSALLAVSVIHGAAADPSKETKNEDKVVCAKTAELTKIMNDKSFFHLLNMDNKNDVTETIWVGGTDIVITAQEKDSSCVIAMMKNVIYNPDTIQGLLKAYENQTKKQKDI